MVRIINYKEREKEDGTSFFLLELQGGIQMVKSQESGRFYATAKRAFISSTFDELTCEALIGSEMPGKIIKEECEPYDYLIKETGEEITLSHRWVYAPEESSSSEDVQKKTKSTENIHANVEKFSKNGVPELEDQFV